MDTMNLESFAMELKTAVDVQLKDREIKVQDFTKNNGVILKGMVIKEKNNPVAPTIYINKFYEQYKDGTSIDDICESITGIYWNCKNCGVKEFDISSLLDFEKVSDKIRFKIVNFEKNIEQFKSFPHRQILDLMAIYYVDVSENDIADGKASITVNDRLWDGWNVTEEKLWNTALANTSDADKITITSMMDVMNKMMGFEESPEEEQIDASLEIPMYVITNDRKINGAGVIFYPDALRNIREYLHSDFYLLPSSTHEVLAIPKIGTLAVSGLLEMVREVNATQVSEDEVLSDNIYSFEDDTLKLITA